MSDRELFELVYRRMRNLVLADATDFDDLVQAAATEAWRSLPSFQGKSELGTWVYTVCYRVLSNHRRWWRRFNLRFSIGIDDVFASDDAAPPELLDERARIERLRVLLRHMSDKYRAVVMLHDLEGFSVSEIAGIVGANELTVRSRLRDGRKQLRRLVDLDPTLVLEEA
ncbi:MAG TPA: RNA polymerase sigma factor [Polyangiaceae bacterium]|nr:RNA polymerase sigma factor [Polyangiaceae bacterium]